MTAFLYDQDGDLQATVRAIDYWALEHVRRLGPLQKPSGAVSDYFFFQNFVARQLWIGHLGLGRCITAPFEMA